MSTDTFIPRWASAPGATIRDVLNARGISVAEFADQVGVPVPTIESLLAGQEPITVGLARRLESSIGGTVAFWLSRDGQYRDDLAVVATDGWAGGLPTEDMARFGWIERPRTWHERMGTALGFFGVADLQQWRRTYDVVLDGARFRLTAAARPEPLAVAAWLRRAEIESDRITTADWDPDRFRLTLQQVKALTTVRDPERFMPKLTDACAEAGVVVVVVRTPRGCPVSGAARFLDPKRPQIILSARYLSDDHLWFTFYHEAAHILLHGPVAIFVDEFDEAIGDRPTDEESEADDFAGDVLLPRQMLADIHSGRLSPRDIVRTAREAGVSPGIVVGQLQHQGRLGFDSRYNGFKRKYRWHGSSLGRA
jgi:plasmid maintenance system antidote protein VapI/Zn-dependent peptidase ImmA (M78 family)